MPRLYANTGFLSSVDGGQEFAKMTTNLTPEDALEQYLQSRHDATASTVQNHRYRLNYFTQWFDEEANTGDLSHLTGMHCEQFKNWRMENFDLNIVTLQYHIQTLRVFVRWFENVGTVKEGISEKIIVPEVSDSEKARDVHISHERAMQIIEVHVTVLHCVFTLG